MGVTAYACLRVGVPVKRKHFFNMVGTEWKCRNDHVGDGPSFCPDCGERFVRKDIEEPTTGFTKWAEEEKCSPVDLWYGLKDEGSLCSPEPVQSNEDADGELILCQSLRTASEYNKRGPVYDNELEDARVALRSRMALLGIEGKIGLYTILYWSY